MKTGLLVLGCNPEEVNFRKVVRGSPETPGTFVRAIAVMMEENPSIMVISGGNGRNGEEARVMKEMLYQELEQLKDFSETYPILGNVSPDEIRQKLDRILQLEEKATNTAENMALAGDIFEKAGVESVVIIASPDRCSRAIRDALLYWEDNYPELAANVSVTGSRSFCSLRTPEDKKIARMENVIVIEPAAVGSGLNFSGLLPLLGNPDINTEELVDDLNALIEEHQARNNSG